MLRDTRGKPVLVLQRHRGCQSGGRSRHRAHRADVRVHEITRGRKKSVCAGQAFFELSGGGSRKTFQSCRILRQKYRANDALVSGNQSCHCPAHVRGDTSTVPRPLFPPCDVPAAGCASVSRNVDACGISATGRLGVYLPPLADALRHTPSGTSVPTRCASCG